MDLMEKHQSLKVRHGVSRELISNEKQLGLNLKSVSLFRDGLSFLGFLLLFFFPQKGPIGKNHSQNHQLRRLVLTSVLEEFKFLAAHVAKCQESRVPVTFFFSSSP